jgi:hypothetical protein
MNSQQARFVLAAYHPGMRYESDPVMAEAIGQVLRDPELARWFAEELAFDDAVTKALLAQNPPAELQTILLPGIRASRLRRDRRRRAAAAAAMAATLAITSGLALVSWRHHREGVSAAATHVPLVEWQTACVSTFADPNFRLDLTGRDYPSLERHLFESGTRVAGEIPFDIQTSTPIGCKVLAWRGQPVSLVCFRAESGEVLHLFVVSRGIADETRMRDSPHHARVGDFATITWTRHDLIIMVASKMAGEKLASLVTTTPA